MSDVLGSAELDCQHVELLPARTVASMFVSQPTDGGHSGDDGGAMDLLRMANMLPAGTGVGWGDHGVNAAGGPAA
ncbi:MAG: hypothetical protein DLM61_19890 [Pseudonocardiales bacterium]|nr:hypothetical protein [Pseudonocardiales bacterium]PZS25509.1 MAG: hypothetical protein DLM61_19890 [Pseudonocardiales bacterium]